MELNICNKMLYLTSQKYVLYIKYKERILLSNASIEGYSKDNQCQKHQEQKKICLSQMKKEEI